MTCPHCGEWVSPTNDQRAWQLFKALDPAKPGSKAMDGDDLADAAGFHRDFLEAAKRHYRDHVLPQVGLALAYSHATNRYWLTPFWNDVDHPDIRTWGNGMLNRLYHESRHVRDALELAWKAMPTTKRKARLQVKDIYQIAGHVTDRIELALESAALLPPQTPSGP